MRQPREVHVRRIDVVKKGGNWVGRSKGKTVRGTKAKTKEEQGFAFRRKRSWVSGRRRPASHGK